MRGKEKHKAYDAIAAGRIVVGAASYAAPALTGRLFGLDPEGNPQSPYIARLFGARDVVLGAGVLRASRKQKETWAAAGVACDVADVVAGTLAGLRGQLSPASAAMVTATAAAFAAGGLWLLQN